MRRHKHNLSHYRLLTADMGKLVPVSCVEVLAGDTIQHRTSALIRVSPLVAPVMHPVVVRFHHWFVPNRLTWSGWEQFITGGQDGLGGTAGAYPTLNTGAGVSVGSLSDYLGVPTSVAGLVISALPFRAYNLIFNQFYADEDLITPVSADSTTLQSIAWEKDYFTSARPWPQRGPNVSLPLGTAANVMTSATRLVNGSQAGMTLGAASGGAAPGAVSVLGTTASGGFAANTAAPGSAGAAYYPTNLYADLTNATATNVNAVRRAFALQRYAEARARYGARYVEYLRYLGITPSDARLQRPEYLGGGKQTIAFSEVLQTGPDTTDDGVGVMRGHGIAAMRTARYRRFFEEHGYVLTLMSVRPKTMYTQALERHWSRRAKEDYYQRELEQIGQQELYRREVFAESDPNGATIFGYQDRYDDYRRIESTVHGEFRTTLDYWHMGRKFLAAPALNAAFVNCDPTKRIHQEQTTNTLWIMVNNGVVARRMLQKSGKSRIF